MSPTPVRRDFAAEYARRKARAADRGETVYSHRIRAGSNRGLSPTQSAGHPRQTEPSVERVTGRGFGTATIFDAETGAVVMVGDATAGEMRRAGRYLQLVRQLREGRISPSSFRGRVSRWAPIRGHRFLADPRLVLALALTTDQDDIVFRYLRGVA